MWNGKIGINMLNYSIMFMAGDREKTRFERLKNNKKGGGE